MRCLRCTTCWRWSVANALFEHVRGSRLARGQTVGRLVGARAVLGRQEAMAIGSR